MGDGKAGRSARWRPLLDGSARDAALAVVEEIASALPAPGAVESPELAGGDAGIALFFSYLSELRDADDAARGVRHLNAALRALRTARLAADLYSGVAGIAWVSRHLRARLTPGAAPRHRALDDALLARASRSPWAGAFDLIGGLAGLGVYAVEGLPATAPVLEAVLVRLAELAERTDTGVTWHTGPELLPSHERVESPGGHYSLGVAHGVPGVIGMLGLALGAGAESRQTAALLDGAVRWLLAQRLPEWSGGGFDYWTPCRAAGPQPARSAWCYGDPGVATALLLAAAHTARAWWWQEAVELALRAASRTPDATGICDAGLCHGAAGLAHLFNRMFQATGEPRLAEAARFWVAKTLELRRPGTGTAGYAPFRRPDSEPARVQDSAGFLTGAAGIGLTLLAACTPAEPDWDRLLLASIPLQGA